MAALFVDLITPPGSPVDASSGAAETSGAPASDLCTPIDLCTPPASPRAPLATVSNDVASAKALGKRKAEPADANAHKTAKEVARQDVQVHGTPMQESDDEVLETCAPPAPIQKEVQMGEGEDDDVMCTGRSGANALSDFPHARENCAAVRFLAGQEHKHCANCYCYVCDAPATGCPKWSEHCKASHRAAAWQQRRAHWKARQSAPPAVAQPRAAAPRSGHTENSEDDSDDDDALYDRMLRSLQPSAQGEARWSCEQMLKAVEQIYPEEREEPKGFAPGMTLRPYQRQSLAFMINLERSRDAALQGQQTHLGKLGSFGRSGEVSGTSVRGGWLVDEMGMGKTAVCTALALATRGQGRTIVICNNTLVGQWIDELKKFGPDLKVCKYYGGSHGASWRSADVVVTTPATKLPPQEVDLSHRLQCYRLILDEAHLYERGSDPKLPTTRMFKSGMDHYCPDVVWCVTGTPFSHSLEQLEMQARLVGHWKHGLNLSSLLRECKLYESGAQCGWDRVNHNKPRLATTNQQVADKLKQVMIRHSKAQRIRGTEALSLPDSEVATVWLTMSADERLLYDLASCADGIPKWADVNRVAGASLADLSKGLTKRRAALAQALIPKDELCSSSNREISATARAAYARLYGAGTSHAAPMGGRTKFPHRTKFQALKADLSALCAAQPDVSVVVFTHHNSVLADVGEMLRKELRMTVYEVSRATDPAKRHSALRSFQAGAATAAATAATAAATAATATATAAAPSGAAAASKAASSSSAQGARAFCTTFATAAVGLTLTAASRVYLLEASLDPAQEAQAAGRIHRLGQTKEVLVRRFYFKDSLDGAVHSLHEQIKAGALTLEHGRFPRAALQLLRDHGVADPHQPDPNAPLVETQRRYRSTDKRNVRLYGGEGGFDYGKAVQTRACLRCGKGCEVAGTSVWWGKGKWHRLNGDTSDHPAVIANMEPADERDD